MSGDTDDKSPGDDSGNHPNEGEVSGDLRRGRIRFQIPEEWIHSAAPAMLVVAYVMGVAIAILIVCFGISLVIK